MGIISSFQSSKNDLDTPIHKTYWGFDFDVSRIDVNHIRTKTNHNPTEKRMLGFDLDEEESIEQIVVLNNRKKELGRFTTEQVKEILSDIGCNVNPLFVGKHLADIEAVMNVGGYSIPGWVKFARIVTKFFPSREKLLLTKLSPGKDRLHIIAYESNDGSWKFAAHTDFNWLSLNLPRIYSAHVGHGAGDYVTGTLILYELLSAFGKKVKANKILTVSEIHKIIRSAYDKSLMRKLGHV
jgi:hypothetical protein